MVKRVALILALLTIPASSVQAQAEPVPSRSPERSEGEGKIYDDPVRSNIFLSLNSDGSKFGGEVGVDYRFLSPLRLRTSFDYFPDIYTYLAFGPTLSWRYFGAGLDGAILISPAPGFEPLLTLRFGEEEGLRLSLTSLGLMEGENLLPKLFRGSLGWAISDTGLISLTYGFEDFKDKRGDHERDLALISYSEEIDKSLSLSLSGGLVFPRGEGLPQVPTYALSLGGTYRFTHGFLIPSVPLGNGNTVDLSFGDLWKPPSVVTRRSGFGESILNVVFLPPALVYIMSASVDPEHAYRLEADWRKVRRVYEDIPRFGLSLGGGILSSGGIGEISLSYKFAGPYRIEGGVGSAISRFTGKTYYPILFRTFYHYGLFPFLPSGDWRFIGFGLGLVGGLSVGDPREILLPSYPSLAPSLALRFGSEDSIFGFLDVGDVPYVSGGISGAAAGVGMSLSGSTQVALMGGVPTYTDALGDFVRPIVLGSVEQGLGDIDRFLGGLGIFENVYLRLSLGLGTETRENLLRSPRFSLGISYKLDRLPEEVAVSELMKGAEEFEKREDWAQATAKYRKIISDYPGSKWVAEVRFRAAQAYEHREMFDEALSEYRILAERYPSSQWNILSQITIGRRAVRDGNWREAHKAFVNVLAAQPTGRFAQEARYWAEYSSVKLEDWERANIVLEEFTEFYPKSELIDDALYLLGESYFSRGRYTEAITYYQRVLENSSNGNRAALSLMRIGYSYLNLGEVDAARSSFEKVLQDYPDQPEIASEAKEQLGKIVESAED